MSQKVVLDPVDFEKVVSFVTDQKVSINHLERASEVVRILSGAAIMEITISTPDQTVSDTSKV